jgi:hypothetical protein
VSSHYEVVFSLDLRDNVPTAVIDELEWQLGRRADRPGSLAVEYDVPLLQPAAHSYLAGGEHGLLERAYRYSHRGVDHHAWSLFARLLWVDDMWAEYWWQVATWLAEYAETKGYGGFFREESELWPTMFMVSGGYAYLAPPGEQPKPFSSEWPAWS